MVLMTRVWNGLAMIPGFVLMMQISTTIPTKIAINPKDFMNWM
jgi:hypothetical protein